LISEGIKLRFKKVAYFNSILTGYVDSDWAKNKTKGRSTSGCLFKMFKNFLVSWSNMKQKPVAASSTKADYMV